MYYNAIMKSLGCDSNIAVSWLDIVMGPFKGNNPSETLSNAFPLKKPTEIFVNSKGRFTSPIFISWGANQFALGYFISRILAPLTVHGGSRFIHQCGLSTRLTLRRGTERAFQGISSSARRHLLKYALRWSAVIPMICTYI